MTASLRLKSEILKDQNGKIISIEEFVYNDIGKVVRQDYMDATGNRKFYKTFEYDTNGNCIKTCEFADNNEIQVSFEYSYDNNYNQVKTIERTAEGSIWDWTEVIMQPNNNLKVWLAKDENGNIIHKTEKNLLDHSERRYNAKGNLYLYEIYKREFDTLNRLIEETVTNENGEEKRKNLYTYDGQKEIWTFISEGKIIKTEEKGYDGNRNLTYYIRKDSDGNCLEWYGFEFDKFGNKTKYFWGQEEGKQVGYKTYERIYD